jgi:hypothetical protein
VQIVISATVDPVTPDGAIITNSAIANATTADPNSANNASSTTTRVATSPLATPMPTATPQPSPSGSLADTGAGDWGGETSPTMLLLVVAAWLLLTGALAVESAWRRRART